MYMTKHTIPSGLQFLNSIALAHKYIKDPRAVDIVTTFYGIERPIETMEFLARKHHIEPVGVRKIILDASAAAIIEHHQEIVIKPLIAEARYDEVRINSMELPQFIKDALELNHIETLAALLALRPRDLNKLVGIGDTAIRRIKTILGLLGLSLKENGPIAYPTKRASPKKPSQPQKAVVITPPPQVNREMMLAAYERYHGSGAIKQSKVA